MAARKPKVALQIEVDSQAAFEELLNRKGLKVLDVYSEWCGPCKAIVSALRRIKNELADDLLILAKANADKIDSLSAYRGTSEPTFLFYGGQTLVGVVRGPIAPQVEATLRTQLQNEHDVIENNGTRTEFIDEGAPQVDLSTTASNNNNNNNSSSDSNSNRKASLHPDAANAGGESPAARRRSSATVHKTHTFALIKPDVASDAAKCDEIFTTIAESGMRVVHQEDVELTKERAEEFYAEHKGKPFFDNLVEFMTSGPLKAMVLSAKADAVAKWREVIGPTSTDTAKESAPESIRARFGTDNTKNAAHGSDSQTSAVREIMFFFPDWAKEHLPAEELVVVVKPDAVEKVDDIVKALEGAGFAVTERKEMENMAPEMAQTLLGAESPEDPAVAHLCSGKSVALAVSQLAGIAKMAALCGPASVEAAKADAPDSLRAQFGTDDTSNAVHCSANAGDAKRDIALIFAADKPAEPESSEPAPAEAGEGEDNEGGDGGDGDEAEGGGEEAKEEGGDAAAEGEGEGDKQGEGEGDKQGDKQGDDAGDAPAAAEEEKKEE